MQNEKTTPGPWYITDMMQIRSSVNGYQVAQCSRPDRRLKGKESIEEWEFCKGNAKLLAAAPMLFSALQGILNNSMLDETEYGQEFLAAKAAIDSAL